MEVEKDHGEDPGKGTPGIREIRQKIRDEIRETVWA